MHKEHLSALGNSRKGSFSIDQDPVHMHFPTEDESVHY